MRRAERRRVRCNEGRVSAARLLRMLDLAEQLEQNKDTPPECPDDILRDHFKQGRTWKQLSGRKDGDDAYKFGTLVSSTVTAHRRPYAIGPQLGTPAQQQEPLLEAAQRPHGRPRQLPVRRRHDERHQGSPALLLEGPPADRATLVVGDRLRVAEEGSIF